MEFTRKKKLFIKKKDKFNDHIFNLKQKKNKKQNKKLRKILKY